MEFSIRSIINLFRKNLVIIILVTLLASFLSYGYTKFFVNKVYACDVKFCVNTLVNVEDDNNSTTLSDDIRALNYSQKLVDSCIQILSTNSFFETVSQRLDGKYSAAKLKNMITYSCLNSTEYFRVYIKGTSTADIKKIGEVISEVAPPAIENVKTNLDIVLVDRAKVTSNPISPDTTRNVIIGTAAGFFIIVLILILKDYLDIRIKSTDEKLEKLGLPVLARIPDFSAIKKKK